MCEIVTVDISDDTDFRDDLSIRLAQHTQNSTGCRCGVEIRIPFLASSASDWAGVADHFTDIVIEFLKERQVTPND